MSAPIGLGHQIDGLRGAANEDDFLRIGGADELAHFLAPAFVEIGRTSSQGMRGSMNVRVVMAVKARGGIDDALWFLRRGGVVEPNERIPIDMLPKNRKVSPDRFDFKP